MAEKEVLNAGFFSAQLPGYFTVDEARELAEDNVFTITIANIREVVQGAKAEDKPVLSFAKKSLVLNKSRCNQLGILFGKDALVGKQIRLSVEAIMGRDQITVVSPE